MSPYHVCDFLELLDCVNVEGIHARTLSLVLKKHNTCILGPTNCFLKVGSTSEECMILNTLAHACKYQSKGA